MTCENRYLFNLFGVFNNTLWQMISFIAYHRKMLYSMENLLASYFLPMCQENKSESETTTGIQCFQLPQFVSNVMATEMTLKTHIWKGLQTNVVGYFCIEVARFGRECVCRPQKFFKKKMLIRVIMEIKRLIKK